MFIKILCNNLQQYSLSLIYITKKCVNDIFTKVRFIRSTIFFINTYQSVTINNMILIFFLLFRPSFLVSVAGF